jgi:hypothetical protein
LVPLLAPTMQLCSPPPLCALLLADVRAPTFALPTHAAHMRKTFTKHARVCTKPQPQTT